MRDPRFIETVATVGYRWVCKVEVEEESAGISEAAGETSANWSPVDAGGQPPTKIQEKASHEIKTGVPKKRSRNWVRRWLFSCAAVIAFSLAILIWLMHRPLPPARIAGYTQITHDGREKLLAGTDGSRLYFTQMQPKALAQVGVAGGEVAQIPANVPGIFYLLDVAPDGSNLLVQALEEGGIPGKPLFDVGTLGGTVRRVGYAESAAFSPDGNSIAYTNDKGELWLVRSDGTGDRKLASVGSDAANPHWSPDGSVIGFDRNGEQHEGFSAPPDGSLWEISSDGSNLRPMMPGWHSANGKCCGRWTPDGKFYLFLSSASALSQGDQIWALDERRGTFRDPPAEPVQLTSGPISWSQPIPGKDGKTIFSEGRTHRGELCRFDSNTKQLLPYLGGISAQDVSFSKDGQSVAYVTYPDGVLWKANRDGSNPVQLSKPPIYAMNPRWSPDGMQILFWTTRESKIYLVSAEGGIPQRLLPDDTAMEGDPNWSPDGRKVIFGDAGGGLQEKEELRTLDLSSHEVTVLPGSANLWSPRWSPNGKYIAAMSADYSGLKVLDTTTQRWLLLPMKEGMGYPAWSSDSQSIYLLRLINGDRGVYRVRVPGGKTERVADLKDWHITGYYSYWMGLDPTDAPLLLRDVGSDDIYALTLEEK